jgi:hypothetical protein
MAIVCPCCAALHVLLGHGSAMLLGGIAAGLLGRRLLLA